MKRSPYLRLEHDYLMVPYFSGLLMSGVMPDGTTRFTCKGKPLYQFTRTGTFSEYTVVPEAGVVKVRAVHIHVQAKALWSFGLLTGLTSCFALSILF